MKVIITILSNTCYMQEVNQKVGSEELFKILKKILVQNTTSLPISDEEVAFWPFIQRSRFKS